MIVEGERLSFEKTDADSLLCVLWAYIPSHSDSLPHEKARRLKRIWERAGDFACYHIIEVGVFGEHETSYDDFARAKARINPEPLLITPDDLEVLHFSGARKLLTEVFQWAQLNLVAGGVFIQNVRGQTLNSSYEDTEISRALGSTNASLADSMTGSIIEAGRKAGEWLLLLTAEE